MAALVMALAGCGRGAPRSGEPAPLSVDVLADTGRSLRLAVRPPAPSPAAAVWLARVSPSRPRPIEAPLPTPSPAPVPDFPDPPRLQVDEALKPPLLRHAGVLHLPPGTRGGSVELDVRVTEEGDVSDALWAGGSKDSLLVAAATACALEMRFFPALQVGRPVAVWCRQRFDFGSPRGR
jgi:Gram-negative bacterial TonB protein C-terminal